MKLIKAVHAAMIAVGLGMAGQAGAMPQPATPADSDGLVIKVQQDCHSDVRRHYLPEYGARVWHYHRQSNCRAVRVDPREDDDRPPRDCHRDVRRHYIPEYGRQVTHSHVGQSCRVKEYRRHSGGGGGGSCITIGPIQYCEN